jgi:hypothetical protein
VAPTPEIVPTTDHRPVTYVAGEDEKSFFEASILEMSPSKVKQIVLSSRQEVFDMIQEKESQIEENIKHETTISSKINIGIIEDLKRRRLEQRQQNAVSEKDQNLETRRDQVIHDIQK